MSTPMNQLAKVSMFYVIRHTYKRDLTGILTLFRAKWFIFRMRRKNATAVSMFQQNVTQSPDRHCLMDHNKKWTYKELDEFSNKIANYLVKAGCIPRDDVAIMMGSSPEYISCWLGCAKAGVVPALVNNNQKMDTLAHSVNIVKAKCLIFDQEHAQAVTDAMPLMPGVKFIQFDKGMTKGAQSMFNDMGSLSKAFTAIKRDFNDRLFYIYTSGTTGFPKAVIFRNSRYLTTSAFVHNLTSFNPKKDVLYSCLPLHHFAGGVMGTSLMIVHGIPLAIRSKFSASQYWEDCITFNATAAQYIGELCRFLYTQPERENERKHKVRVIIGNGMRPNLWTSFQTRFCVPKILELYGTSEGNAQIANLDNHPGACGFIAPLTPRWLLKLIYPVNLIKCDPDTGEVVRDARGMCVMCEPGEVGQFVGKIVDGDPTRSFDGYSDKKETDKRIIHNVFHKGDKAFASGDMLYTDALGYLYFHDRTGDTFRWKGENVSTTEVEALVQRAADMANSVVLGVEIPGCEGRAGMAVIESPGLNLDMKMLMERVTKSLPNYAIPVFIRLTKKIEETATFKLVKGTYQKDGYNVTSTTDPMYVLSSDRKSYQRLTPQLYDDICKGKRTF